MALEPPVEVRTDALRLLSNGVYVLTVCAGDTIHAATVTWATQASVHPPLVLMALRRNSHLADAVRKAHRCALNILETGQEALAATFFEHMTTSIEAESLGSYAFRSSPGRCPLLLDALGWLECRVAAEPETPGDHSLILGEVVGAGVRREGSPMVLGHTPWAYGMRIE
jgi:flavin reductase (DIM6/NTAB) family NADH-FMN oxidoreductase RutF